MIAKQQGRGEFGIVGLLLALGVIVLVDTQQTRVPATAGAAGPQFFPYAVGGLLMVIGVWLAVDIMRKRRSDASSDTHESTESEAMSGATDIVAEDAQSDVPTDWKAMALVVVIMIAHVALMPVVGYVIAAFGLFWGTAFAYGSKRIPRDPIIALCVAVVIYVGFTEGLSIHLPAGILEGVL